MTQLVDRFAPRWAMISTYPPTQCGLATFTRSLVNALTRHGTIVDVIRVVDDVQPAMSGVSHQLVTDVEAPAVTAAVLNTYDMVVMQHEYGIYGGLDGEDIVAVLAHVTVPVVTVLHTVLTHPTEHQRQVLQGVLDASTALVTMTHTARNRLLDGYLVDPDLVLVIPHGAADALVSSLRPARLTDARRRPYILTWGLLGQGKGIEWGIEALAMLDLDPRPTYVVAGQTHPRVLEYEGERYRSMLVRRAEQLGVADDVIFEDSYLTEARLRTLIKGAAVVLLPYDSVEQVTSGVLIEAVAAGRPVVSTRFPHAVELLGGGTGLVVDQRDPQAIAAALTAVLGDSSMAAHLSARAGAMAPSLSWSSVAARYATLADTLTAGYDTLAVVA